ncbi:MAG: SRPBCC family protein [Chryseobacterium sp.]|nr:MAG: SRPBCC family protein [Chryseobacterium sp.]
MKLEGRKVTVNKPASELTDLLKSPENYRQLMPDSLSTFNATDDGFTFELKGMPKIALKIADLKENEKVVLKSASSSLDFQLEGLMNPISETQTEVQLLFEGKFNPFIKMMVEKPLQNFINALTDKLETL